MRSAIILFVAFVFSFQNSIAQLPAVKTSVDKNNILIGQQINYRISTSMPDNTYRLSWLSIPDSVGNFNVITKNKIDSVYSNGIWNFSQDIILTSFDSGRQVIPPLTLTASTLDGDSTFNLFTDSIAINVTYSPTDSIMPFHDIKNIIEVKKSFPWWAWALVALGIILLIIWILFLFKFFKKKKDIKIFESKLSPYDEAMQLLNDLEKENLLQQNEFKEYYSRLSDIFKRYLSRKTNTYQLHLTTDELLMELKEFDLSKEQLSNFAGSLRMGNAVKFAQYIPPAYENEKSFLQIKEMITAIHNIVNKKPEDGI
ncbi:MAG TPA: hypothetical protein VLI68_10555 [Hanamia sp.]|jgi:hypothetical protein|nr:hypothetical protein [Hanamia sp.]